MNDHPGVLEILYRYRQKIVEATLKIKMKIMTHKNTSIMYKYCPGRGEPPSLKIATENVKFIVLKLSNFYSIPTVETILKAIEHISSHVAEHF